MKIHLKCKKHLKNVGNNSSHELNEICLNDTMIFNQCDKNKTDNSENSENSENIKNKKKIKKNYSCEQCKNKFSCYQNMWRHKKTCKYNENVIIEANEIYKLQQENCVLKGQIKLVTEKMDKLTCAIEKSLKIGNITSAKFVKNYNPINININVFKYVNQNYNSAKPLEVLPPNEARKLLLAKQDKNHSVEEFMLYYYDKHLFDQFIGDVIVNVYKKENPDEQQIWASDVERLSFIIRRVLEENEKLWIKDLKGITLTKYIITPILNEVKLIIQDYHKKCVIEMNNKFKSLDELEKISNYAYNCIKLIRDINDKIVHDNILRYIIPQFQLQLIN